MLLRGRGRSALTLVGLGVGAAVCLSATISSAADISWNGGFNAAWGTKQNWSTNSVPSSTDNAKFNSTFTNQPNVSSSATIGGIWMTTGVGQNVTIGGASTLTLAGNTINGTAGLGLLVDNTSAFTLTINCPLLLGATQSWANNSSNLLTIGGAVNLSTFGLTVNGSGSTTISGAISGTGSLTKSGSGVLTLSGSSSYSGGTTINGGTLKISSSANLGSVVAALTINAGTLEIAAGFSTLRDFSLENSSSTIQIDASQTCTISGIVSGSGALNKTGSGTLVLSGLDTFSGGTVVSAGTLQLGIVNSLLSTGSLLVSGGTLDLQSFNQSVGTVTLTSGTISSSTGVLTGSSFALQSGTIGAIIAGTGSVTKSTSGTVVLSGGNLYTGATLVNAGTLQINTNGALGTTLNGTTVASGAALKLNNVNYSTAEPLTLNGSGISGGGALTNSGTSTFAGAITIATNSTISAGGGVLSLTGGISKNGTTLTLAGGGTIYIKTTGITGALPNSDLVIDGTTVELDTASTYNGPTTIQNSGTLRLGASNVLPSSPQTDLTVNSSSVFDLNSYSDGVASLTGDSTAIIKNSVASSTSTLTVHPGSGSTTFAGVIAGTNGGTRGDIALVKTGNGTLVLTGANTFSGSTTISGGTLTLADTTGSALGSTSSITVNSGGTLLLGASNQINNSAGITLAGGTFSKGNYSEGTASSVGMGALTLTASGSHIDFGTGTVGVLTFASFTSNSNTLIIDNWTGTPNTVGNAGTDRLIFNSDQAANLSKFWFSGYTSGVTEFSLGGGYYEVVPAAVPEPPTYLGGILGFLVIASTQIKRRHRKRRRVRISHYF